MSRQASCADRIDEHCESRLEELRHYMCRFDYDDCEFDSDKNVLVVKEIEVEVDIDYPDDYIVVEGGDEYDVESMFNDYQDALFEAARDRYFEWGLSFEFDDDIGCWRYQLSWGGPSDEFRIYRNRVEYWFLDWFDGAHKIVTNESAVQIMVDDFKEIYYDQWEEKFDEFDSQNCDDDGE